jgi:hypothetical protein
MHGHNTSNKLDVLTRYYSTVLDHSGVTNMGIKLVNKFPVQIKQVDSYKYFEREVKNPVK